MPPSTGQQKIALPGVKTVLAVASGKGGVGKSTTVANLALAIHMGGNRVGLVDADIYGPSIPRMMGVPGVVDQSTTRLPIERYGVKLMSMGSMVAAKNSPPTRECRSWAKSRSTLGWRSAATQASRWSASILIRW